MQSAPVYIDRKSAAPPLSPPKQPASPRRLSAGASLRALEQFMQQEVAALPPASPHRLASIRHVFNQTIASLPAHGPLLAAVKAEYDVALSARPAPPAPAPARRLEQLHPLQLPAAHYEAQWRHAASELEATKLQRDRLARLAASLRAGAARARRSVVDAGGRLSGREGRVVGAREAASDQPPGIEPGAPLAGPGAAVSDELEAAVAAELAALGAGLDVLERRALGAARAAAELSRGAKAARAMVEALVEQAAEPEHAASLRLVLQLLRTQEVRAYEARKLLEPGWDAAQLAAFMK